MKKTFLAVAALMMVGTTLAQKGTITLYSGRGKTFVEPIVEQFEKETGIKVNVRYGKDAELVALLRQEGSRSPADLFWGNSLGALGQVEGSGLFAKLNPSVTRGVAREYLPASNEWVPTTVRYRVLAYNTDKVKPEQLPASVFDLPKMTQFKGRVGWTLSYPSFQDFLAGMIAQYGEAKTKQWLLDMKKLNPVDYKTSNVGMMDAIRAGQIDIGLTNHYYIQRVGKLGYPVGTHFFKAGDIGNLGNATGIGLLKTSKNPAAATRLIQKMVSPNAQNFFMGVNFEYPVISRTYTPSGMLPYSDVVKRSPQIKPSALPDNIEKAQKLLRETGLL
ncbi:extracellular solute-binding protein [Deinococcus lacus]|uniref:Extracellular solute-binding protein n=1 Tax=Deinococcus lacus TaxID=392561 RepID=A0ABW1YDJ5_9DEIO